MGGRRSLGVTDSSLPSESAHGTSHTPPSAVEDIRLYYRGPYVSVSVQLLNSRDVVPVLNKVCGKRVAKGIALRW